MARLPRLIVPDQPHHVILRGNNRCPVFSSPKSYEFYVRKLYNACDQYGCRVHAYVLMTNHIHLLITPSSKSALSQTLQMTGRHYVPFFNRLTDRTGGLYESRYRSTVVDSEAYLLTCMRYIELNPIRAGMVEHPADYRWSSYGANALGQRDELVSPHPIFLRLAPSSEQRQKDYRAIFRQKLSPSVLDEIRQSTNGGWALGDQRFQDRISHAIGRRTSPKPRGRQQSRNQT